MKEVGKEVVEIAGVEYTLFLNRKGVVAWEKYAKKEAEVVKELSQKVQTLPENIEISDDTNPFEGLESYQEIEDNSESVRLFYQKLYWIMLYENHKFSLEKAKEIYDLGCEEYGDEQMMALGNQMLQDVNSNNSKTQNTELKNLKALRPTK